MPDLSGDSPNGKVVPNAQNAVRQGRLLATNIVASLRGRPTRQYLHHNLGTIATLGMGRGAFQSGRIGFTGFLGLADPSRLSPLRSANIGAESRVCWPVGWRACGLVVTSSQSKMRGIRALPLSNAEFLRATQHLIAMRAPRARWLTLHAPIDRRLRHPRCPRSVLSRGSRSHTKADCSSCS